MDKTSFNFSVLIPDGESDMTLVLQVIYCFSTQKNVKVYVLSSNKNNFIKYSRFIEGYSYHKETNDEEWIKTINDKVDKYSIDVILPVKENGIKRLLENRQLLTKESKLCLLPSLNNFEIARDKGLLYKHLKKHEISCPESRIFESKISLDNLDLKFPVIAKPVAGFGGGRGIKVLNNNQDLIEYCSSFSFQYNMIIQEFIEGFDISCNVFCKDGEIVLYSLQKPNKIRDKSLSPLTEFSFVENQELIYLLKKLMNSLNWSGIANIDCRFDIKDNAFKIIEINPRLWINVDASALAGINFPYVNCLASLNLEIKKGSTNLINYVNLKGLVRKIIKRPWLIFNLSYLKNNSSMYFVFRDPLPLIFKFIWRTKNIMST